MIDPPEPVPNPSPPLMTREPPSVSAVVASGAVNTAVVFCVPNVMVDVPSNNKAVDPPKPFVGSRYCIEPVTPPVPGSAR